MVKFFATLGCLFILFSSPLTALAQNRGDKKVETTKLDSIVVDAYRAGKKTPVTYSEVSKMEIKQSSPSNSLPMMLNLQPSVVSSTEGGSGLGNSKISIRGSDGSRINVTLNGVAINDSESQEVFWVNLPSLSGFLQSVQLQRGIGTSVNGAGAFGGSINMQTLAANPTAYGSADFAYGSYQTYMTSVGAGTGVLPSGFSFDIRYSHNNTQGYIRNAKANLNSLFASLGWVKGNNIVRVNYILGDQSSGITWEGISKDALESDRRSNPAGKYYDDAGNVKYYDNETDNYQQHYVQALYTHSFSDKLHWTTTLNYTKGDGYYENYKADKKLSSYGLESQIIDGETYKKSDVIIRQQMDNNYMTASTNLRYSGEKLRIGGSAAYSYYDGDHFGNLLWSKYNNDIETPHSWYQNNGTKNDFNIYARAEYDLLKFMTIYADLQYRRVGYKLAGMDKDFIGLDHNAIYNFFNPKAGLTFTLNEQNQLYGSFAVGRKEPTRSDIKDAIKAGRAESIKPERMFDYEIGYRYTSPKVTLGANIYLMEYKDQLVSTGKLSETGYPIKENVAHSYRRGIELSAAWQPLTFFKVDANVTLSKNKIKNYTAWVDNFDNENSWNPLPQVQEQYANTNLTMSPEVVGMAMLSFMPTTNTLIALSGKYIGKQYYDNTSSDERSLPSYFVMGFRAGHNFQMANGSSIGLSLFVDNLLNNKYVSNAWVYRANFEETGTKYTDAGFYPQAEINFTAKISYNF